MIKIRFSPPASLDISAEASELAALRATVLELVAGRRPPLEVAADTTFDSHPYEACLGLLRVSRSDGPTKVAVAPDGAVDVSGSPSNLEAFASFLECEAGSHNHYEYYEGNSWIAPDSVPLVVSASRS